MLFRSIDDSESIPKAKIKKSKTAKEAEDERSTRLDNLIEKMDVVRSSNDDDNSVDDAHRTIWDDVSEAIQTSGKYHFSIETLDSATQKLDDYISEYEDESLTPGEKRSVKAAKQIRKQIIAARRGYETDPWIAGGKPENNQESAASGFASTTKQSSIKIATDIKKDLKKIQGSGNAGQRGFASTSSGGKTMITDEATFFKDIQIGRAHV